MQVVRPLSLGLGASLAIGGICWALEMGMSLGAMAKQFQNDEFFFESRHGTLRDVEF